MEEGRQPVPFDDNAALNELQRLQDAINEHRRVREQAEAAFDDFIRSFQTPTAPPEVAGAPSNVIAAPSNVSAAPAGGEPPAVIQPAEAWIIPAAAPPSVPVAREMPIAPAAQPPAGPPPSDPIAREDYEPQPLSPAAELPESPAPPAEAVRRPRVRYGFVAAGVAVVLIAGALLIRSWRPAPAAAPPPEPAHAVPAAIDESAPPPVEKPASVPPADAAAPSAAADPPTPPAELTVLRRVWVRVVVDGRRAVEGELQADAHVPLGAGRTIVIRTGDAGAIRLAINGKDQGPLGRDGEVVTRTFTVSASSQR